MITFSNGVQINENDTDLILKILPPEFDTTIMYYNPNKNKELHLKIEAKSVDDTLKWLQIFEQLSHCSYIENKYYNPTYDRYNYKKRYNCSHNTITDNTNINKSKNCASSLIICFKKHEIVDSTQPCEIKVKLEHNHTLDNVEYEPKIKEKLLELYSQGHKPLKALKQLKKYFNSTPDLNYCQNLYLQYQHGVQNNAQMNEEFLTNLFEKYNLETNEISAEMAVCENGISVCLVPPMARRCHQNEDSCHLVFVESFLSKNNRIFLFLCPTEIGVVPLGIIIINSDNLTLFRIGCSLFKEMLNDMSFFGNVDGPDVFLIDEYLSNDNILASIWPKSQCFVSIFHVLQNVWHWLSNSKNNIGLDDRALLFRDFYNVLYAPKMENFNENYETAQKNACKYKNYYELLQNYFNKQHIWALYTFPDILKTDNINLKYSECTLRFLKKHMFKNFDHDFLSIIQFCINTFFTYFEDRLMSISFYEIPDMFCLKIDNFSEDILKKIQILGPNMRIMPSQSKSGTYYIINTDLLTCTCPNSNVSSICKHVQCVSLLLYKKNFEENCQNYETKKKCYYLASGQQFEDTFQVFEDTLEEENPEMFDETEEVVQNEETVNKCKDICNNILNVFQNFASNSEEKFEPVLQKISSKFEAINSVQDFRHAFNIFDSVPKKNLKRKFEDEESIENISNYIVQINNM